MPSPQVTITITPEMARVAQNKNQKIVQVASRYGFARSVSDISLKSFGLWELSLSRKGKQEATRVIHDTTTVWIIWIQEPSIVIHDTAGIWIIWMQEPLILVLEDYLVAPLQDPFRHQILTDQYFVFCNRLILSFIISITFVKCSISC